MSSNENREAEAILQTAGAETAAALQMVQPADDPRIIRNNPAAEIIKGTQRKSSAWLHSPAYLILLSMAARRLRTVSREALGDLAPLQKVRAARMKGRSQIYIYPTHDDDPEGIQVVYYKSSVSINLVTLLGLTGMTVEPGSRARYEIKFASPSSPFGPALVFDLDKPLERKTTPKRRSVSVEQA